MISISPDELVDCSAAISDYYAHKLLHSYFWWWQKESLKLWTRMRRPCWRLQLSSLSAMLLGFWGPIWLTKAPYNKLSVFKSAFNIKDQYPKLGQALHASMQRHSWYLSEQLVLCYPSEDDIEKLKSDKLKRLNSHLFLISSKLGSQSCLLFWCQHRCVGLLVHRVGYFCKWLKFLREGSKVIQRAAIRLIQDFVGGYKSEDMKQNFMLVARDNRKKHKKYLS